jgi:hypothetical protein
MIEEPGSIRFSEFALQNAIPSSALRALMMSLGRAGADGITVLST